MQVKVKKLVSEAVVPSYAKPGDAGMDLTATSVYFPHEELYIEYGTDLSIEIPVGYVGLIFPRSSISKFDLSLANAVGVIDSGYKGEVKCRFKHIKYDGDYHIYKTGDRIAQLMILPIPTVELVEVDDLSDTDRGEGGFGHSGK